MSWLVLREGSGGITVRESRAGDDFHVLWAARRTLQLLDPTDPLTLVRVEGLAPEDAADDDDRYLACDLAEYDGAASMIDAAAVRLVQLKYSTRHPGRPWTAAALAQRPTKGQSIIRRLADMFGALVDDAGREQALAKATVALVSNRPVATELTVALAMARTALSAPQPPTTRQQLQRAVGTDAADLLGRLFASSGLGVGRFLDFLRVLDVSGCDAGARHEQSIALHQGVGGLVLGRVGPAVLGLETLVRSQVMPEARDARGIRAEDVLAALDAPGRAAVFPYPSSLRLPDSYVSTSQATELAAAVLQADLPLLAHGNLGIGKTTTVLRLQDALPPGSQVVIFDCFADGQHHLPNQDRHTYRALLQMANDVALRVGLHPVVAVDSVLRDGQLFEALQETLNKASALVGDGAVLVLAVDAADNAVLVARARNESCFVDGLWHMALPPNVRLVMTARSVRREDVVSGADTPPAEAVLSAFDAAASAHMLRLRHPAADDAACLAFHRNSHGVARVQNYALGRSSTAGQAVDQAKAELSDIFAEIVRTAMTTTVASAERAWWLAAIAVAGRPASTAILADVLGQPQLAVEQLVHAMGPALTLVDGRIRFADEDFEAYLARSVDQNSRRAAHLAFAERLWARRATDDEAALHLATHLDGAGQHERLIALARDEGPPAVVVDGFVRARTYRTRVRLAMSAAQIGATGQTAEPLQLLLAAADAARSDNSLRDTIRSAPDLATLHAEPSAVADAVLHTTSEPWRGKLHLRAAFVLAVHHNRRDEAGEQLDLAQAWLRAWSLDPDRRSGDFDAEDLAHGALAALLLDRAPLAWKLATGWRPLSFAASVGEHIVALAPAALGWAQFAAELHAGRVSSVVKAQAAVHYARAGVLAPVGYWRVIARRLAVASARASGPWISEFCQFALEAGVARSTVRRILERRVPSMRYLDSWTAVDRLLPYLHNRVMCEVLAGRTPDVGKLRPADLGKSAAAHSDGQARIYDQLAPNLIELLTVDVSRSLARADSDVVTAAEQALETVHKLCERLQSGATHRFPDRGPSQRGLLRQSLLVVGDALAMFEKHTGSIPTTAMTQLLALVDALPQSAPDMLPSLLLDLAERLRVRRCAAELSDPLIRQAAAVTEAAEWPPSERRDVLLRAARVALVGGYPDGEVMSADLFGRAVVVASSLDVDVAARLRCLLQLVVPQDEHDQDVDLARHLLHAVEAATSKVDDPDAQLPHTLALRVTTALAPTVGLPASLRWADEDRLSLDSALAAAVAAAARLGPLDLDQAVTLLGLRQPELFSVLLLRSTVDAAKGRADSRAVILRRLPSWAAQATTNAGGAGSAIEAAALRGWIDEQGIGANQLGGELLAFEQSRAAGTTTSRSAVTSSWESPRRSVDFDALIAAASQPQAQEHLAMLRSTYASEPVLASYLLSLARREQGGRVSTLTFLATLAEAGPACPARVIARVIAQLVEEWSTSPGVISWTRRALPDWTARHLPDLFDHVYEPGEYPRLALQLPSRDSVVRERTWTELARQLDQFSPEQLFAAAVDLGSADINGVGRRIAVRWALDRAETDPPPALAASAVPSGQLFTRILLAAFGHEDARRRWLAARALREHLLLTRDVPLAERLLTSALAAPAEVLDDCQLSGTLPRPLTALQWLLTALSQVNAQDPRLLSPMADTLAAIACDTDLPHAAIRELARRAVPYPTAGPTSRTGELALANRPRRSTVHEQDWGRDDDRDTGSARFHFSAMDTLPYWFAPLARVFYGITTSEIVRRCDVWITDRWRRSWDDDCKFDPRALRRRNDYMLTSNDHGSLPTIETAESYLEYHAMMLVAGALTDTGEVERPAYSDSRSPWVEWLDGYLPTQPWIGDERRPMPAAAVALGDDRLRQSGAPGDAEEHGAAGDGTGTGTEDGSVLANNAAYGAARLDVTESEIVVSSSVHGSRDGSTYSAWTESALVNSEAVPSLIAALRHSGQAPLLPTLDDEGPPWGRGLTLPSLTLRGWLRRRHVPATDVDRTDPAGFGPGPPDWVEPPLEFTEYNDATSPGCWRRLAWAAVMYGRPESRGEADSRSGTYTAVTRTKLLDYLTAQGMCLLLTSSSRIHPPSRSGPGQERLLYEASHCRILWPDGREDELHGYVRSQPLRY